MTDCSDAEHPALSGIHWVAHRGIPTQYPENSLPGFAAAVELGAAYLECDIQFSGDQVPMLFHDPTLERMTGQSGPLSACSAQDLMTMPLRWPVDSTIGADAACIAPLADLLTQLRPTPELTLFVELKVDSIHALGHETYLDLLWPILESARNSLVLISYSSRILELAKKRGPYPIGWIIPEWTDANHARANALQPDWLICNHLRLPDADGVWQGRWQWAIYTIDDHATALRMLSLGMTHLETNRLHELGCGNL